MQDGKHVLVVGCGDVGSRLAARLRADGWAVEAWARRGRTVDFGRIEAADLDADGPLPKTEAALCVYLVPPPRNGDSDPRLTRFLAQPGTSLQHIIYAGTSGVYGDCQGRWVDESAPLRPADDRAKRRVDAEQQIADWAAHSSGRAVRLRLATICRCTSSGWPASTARGACRVLASSAATRWCGQIRPRGAIGFMWMTLWVRSARLCVSHQRCPQAKAWRSMLPMVCPAR